MTETNGSRISRRAMLAGASSLIGGGFLGLGSDQVVHAEELDIAKWEQHDPTRVLRRPDFRNRAADSASFVTGVRPKRIGGIRTDRSNYESARKIVVHHYGHGGAGMTLAWGSAKTVLRQVKEAARDIRRWGGTPSILVLGAGIAGLTVARELAADWQSDWGPRSFRVYAQRFRDTTSYIAGGQFEPSIIHTEYTNARNNRTGVLRQLLADANAVICGFSEDTRRRYGIERRRNFSFDRHIPGFNPAHMPTPPVVFGPSREFNIRFEGSLPRRAYEYETWLINPTLLMPALRDDLTRQGVIFQIREDRSVGQSQVLNFPENIIVNCTGIGSKALFPDSSLTGVRGHLVKLDNPNGLRYLLSFGCTPTGRDRLPSYIFCRQTDIIVGGSWDDDANYSNPLYTWPRYNPNEDSTTRYPLRCDPRRWQAILNRSEYLLNGMMGCPIGGPR